METSTKPRVTAKDFFLWLGAMVALYVSATSLILLAHQFINVLLPNPLEYGFSYSDSMRFAIASLIVFFPLYIWLTRMLHQDIRKVPEKKELWVRKWLVYLTLFFAGLTLAIDLVMLVNTFLNGDLTTRFALKALVVFVVVGAAFWYYIQELGGKWEREEKTSKMIGALVSLVVLGAIASSFFIVGSPQSQRLLRFDEQRVYDLQNIQGQIVNYWQQKEMLPKTAADLEDPLVGFTLPKDPETGLAYPYESTGAMSFRLCATFSLPSRELPEGAATRPQYPAEESWQHGEGEQCFDRTIDPERFPPFTKPTPR